MNSRFTQCLILLSIILTQSVIAEKREDVYTLDTVVVQAHKEDDTNYQTGDVYLEETPAFYSLIERDRFDGKIESLADVIEKEAGVHVSQIAGFGSYSVLSIRGSTSDQVMIYMDGILLNDASGGGVDLSNISLSDVESIEIYRGITPANFSNASIGGVVNIKTLRTKKGFTGNYSTGKASFGTTRVSTYVNNNLERLDYVLSAEYTRAENDFEILNENKVPLSPADWTVEKRNNAVARQYNFLGKVGHDFSEFSRITLVSQWFSKDQGIPRRDNKVNSTRFDTDRGILTAQIIADNLGTFHLNTKTRVTYLWKEEDYDDRKGQIGKGRIHTLDKTDTLNGNFFCEYLTENNSFSFNFDIKSENYQTIDFFKRKNPNKSKRETYIITAQNTHYFLKQKLNTSSALRMMQVNNNLKDDTDVYGNRVVSKDSRDTYWMPQLGIKYRWLKWLTLKSNIARYVRLPSFFELFGDRGFFSGNPELKPEKGQNFDIGFEINRKPINEYVQRIKWSALYFLNNTVDRIEPRPDSAGFYKEINLSKSRVHGLETSMILDFSNNISTHFNYTLQRSKNLSDESGNNEKKLPNCLENSFAGRIEATLKPIKVFYEFVLEDGLYFDEAEVHDASTKRVSNAGIVWSYDMFQANFDIKNIENNEFEEFFKYPHPGRSYALTVKYKF